MTKLGKQWMVTGFIIGGAFLIFIIVDSLMPHQSRYDQIRSQCDEEFGGYGNEQVSACVLKVQMNDIQKMEDDRMTRASR